MKMNVLIVCTGNTCRSPMGEGILKSMIKNGDNINVLSAGVFAADGERASKNAVIALSDMNIDISGHVSHSVNSDVVDEADLILTMTNSHKSALLTMYPEAQGKTYTVCEYAGINGEIADPYGQSLDVYKSCAEMLYKVFEIVYEKIQGGEK